MREERQIIILLKILITLFLILIVIEFQSCVRARAAVVTGEKPLGGFSLMRQQVIDHGLALPEAEDISLLAEVIYHENWHTDPDHLAAYYTGAVVMNRVKSPKWPNTVESVLYQNGQYSTTHKFFTRVLPAEVYALARQILKEGTPDVPDTVIYQAMFRQGSRVWKVVNTDYFCEE